MSKPKCPYTFPHRSRAAKLDYICDIGGYDSYPLSFNVKAYGADLTARYLWDKYSAEYLPNEVKNNPALMVEYRKLYDLTWEKEQNGLWSIGCEGAWRSLEDGDTHQTLWDGKQCFTKFSLLGRSGGHLVITGWNHWDFRGRDLRDTFGDHNCMGYKELDLLYKFCRHWERDFTPENASREIEYQAADFLFFNCLGQQWAEIGQKIALAKGPVLAQRRISVRRTGTV